MGIFMYYSMEQPLQLHPENEVALVSFNNTFKLAGIRLWKSGRAISQKKSVNIPNPVVITYENRNGYTGLPPVMKELGIPLMSESLAEVLLSAGVDTLELFPATLQNSGTKDEYSYKVYNITAYISRENLSESTVLLARLEENVSELVVHESVKEMIEKSGITTLEFKAL